MEFETKVLDKLDSIKSDIYELKIENAKQTKDISQNTKDLAHHIKRSDKIEELVNQNKEAAEARIVYLEKQDAKLHMIWKVVLGLGSLSGIAYGLIRLLPKLGV